MKTTALLPAATGDVPPGGQLLGTPAEPDGIDPGLEASTLMVRKCRDDCVCSSNGTINNGL